VNDPELFEQWKEEMKGMAGRIERVRHELRRSVCFDETELAPLLSRQHV
jgi:aspartate/tyrosine/aromatic aminotransferase